MQVVCGTALTLIVVGGFSFPGGGEGGGVARVLAVDGITLCVSGIVLDTHVMYFRGSHLLRSRGTDKSGNFAGRTDVSHRRRAEFSPDYARRRYQRCSCYS